MLPPTSHPDEVPVRHPLSEIQPSRTAVEGRPDPATRNRRWPPLWKAEPENAEVQAWDWGLWPLLGGLLLLVGVITFFRFLAAAQVAGGCCGGGLVVLAGLIFLVIGLRDQGDFSR